MVYGNVLLGRLEDRVGFSSTALVWFNLNDRDYFVSIGKYTSVFYVFKCITILTNNVKDQGNIFSFHHLRNMNVNTKLCAKC